MSVFLHSVESIVTIFLVASAGYYATAKGWMNQATKEFIGKMLINIAVPGLCMYGLVNNLTKELILGSGWLIISLVIVYSVCTILSYFLAKLLKLSKEQFPIFMMLCILSNSITVGYPICLELFGEQCISFIMLFYLVNTTFTQFLLVYVNNCTGCENANENIFLKLIKSPNIIAIFVGIFFVLSGIKMPTILYNACKHFNNYAPTVSLFLTGNIIYSIGLKNINFDKVTNLVLGFRYLISPCLLLLLASIFGITGLGRNVFTIEASMPSAVMCVTAATRYKADEKFAAKVVATTTILCIVFIPILMTVISYL